MNLSGCQFEAGSTVSVADGKSLCLRNYLPPPSNSSIYTDINAGSPKWSNNAEMQGILTCSGDFYFSSILNSFDKGVTLVTKISANDEGQLVCKSFVEHEGSASEVKTYISNSLNNINSLYFTTVGNTINVSLTVSSIDSVLASDCTYPDPADASQTLSTDSKKLCTTAVKTFGFIK